MGRTSSRAGADASPNQGANQALNTIRCLDVLFGEDRCCRTRHRHAAENLAWLRKMVLCLLRQDDSKGTVPTKQQRAALDDDCGVGPRRAV